MWQALVFVCVFSYALQHTSAFSFFSQVFFRMLFPKPKPKAPEYYPPVFRLKSSKTLRQEMAAQMESGATPEKLIEQLVYTFIHTSREIVPDVFPLPNGTYALPFKGKLYMRLGKVSGIRSYREPIVKHDIDKDGHMDFTVHLQFSNLVATYDSLFLDFYGRLFDRYGRGKLRILKNKFIVKMKVVKTSEIFLRMTQNDCVVYVNTVEAIELSDVLVDIYHHRKKRAYYTSAIVDVIIVSLQEMLQRELTIALAKELWEILPEEKGFACRALGLYDMVDILEKKQDHGNVQDSKATQDSTPQTSPGTTDNTFTTPIFDPDKENTDETGFFSNVANWWKGEPEKQNDSPDAEKTSSTKENNGSDKQKQGWLQSVKNWWSKESPSMKDKVNTESNLSGNKKEATKD